MGRRERPFSIVAAVACVLVVAVLAVIPFAAAVVEARAPGSIPQLAPPPGQPGPTAAELGLVVVVRAVFLVVPLVLAVRAWCGRGTVGLVVVLVLGAAFDLARGAKAGALTVPLSLVAAALLLGSASRAWGRRRA